MSDSQIAALRADFERDLATATTAAALRTVRDRYLSRKGGLVSGLLKSLGSAPAEVRPRLGKLANDLRQQIEFQLDERIAAAEADRPPAGAVDLTSAHAAPRAHRVDLQPDGVSHRRGT
jgi:phenylalanyl-tRNA synthetase alpha chain